MQAQALFSTAPTLRVAVLRVIVFDCHSDHPSYAQGRAAHWRASTVSVGDRPRGRWSEAEGRGEDVW